MKIIVIGAGEIGQALVNLLSSNEHDIVVIEQDDKVAKDVAGATDALVINGDPTDLEILKDAGIEKSDIVVVTTNDDKTNLMVCEISKSYENNKVVSIVNGSKNEELFTKLGINLIVPVVGETITAIKKLLDHDDVIRTVAQACGGDVQIIEATVGDKSKLIGNSARIQRGIIGAIYRDGELTLPTARTKILQGDVLIITVKTKDVKKLKKLIRGR